ncbi:hypothetical protein [Streptomyces sp. NPDC001975]
MEEAMDAAAAAVIFGLAGTLIGAGATYFGPVHAERRRQNREQSIRAEDQASMHLDRYVRARTTVDVWLDLLRRAYWDIRDQRLDLAGFEAEAIRHSEELRARLADLTHVGVPATGHAEFRMSTGDMYSCLRRATNEVRRLGLRPAEAGHSDVLRLRIDECLSARSDWALEVLDSISQRSGTPLPRMVTRNGSPDDQPLSP